MIVAALLQKSKKIINFEVFVRNISGAVARIELAWTVKSEGF
jgi:hypothetical protein